MSTGVNEIASQYNATSLECGELIAVSPEVVFDNGDVWMTDWTHYTYDISKYAGQWVTLKFSIQNAVDRSFATAILIDSICFDGKSSSDTCEAVNLDEFDFTDQTLRGQVMTVADPGLVSELRALNLPWLVETGLIAFGGAVSVPVGNVVDVACGIGLIVVIAVYWDDMKEQWDDIQAIFNK